VSEQCRLVPFLWHSTLSYLSQIYSLSTCIRSKLSPSLCHPCVEDTAVLNCGSAPMIEGSVIAPQRCVYRCPAQKRHVPPMGTRRFVVAEKSIPAWRIGAWDDSFGLLLQKRQHWQSLSDVACLQRLLLDIVVLVYLDLPFAGYTGLFFHSTSFVLSCPSVGCSGYASHVRHTLQTRKKHPNQGHTECDGMSGFASPLIFLFQTFLELFCRVISGMRAVFEAVHR
jgi:hypothetical protein